MLKQITFAALVAFCMSGCEIAKTLDPKGEQFDQKIVDCSRDTSIVINNKGVASSASFTVEGELSHDAKLLWDYKPLDTLKYSSEIPATTREITLNAGKVNVTQTNDYYNKTLYVKYIPSSDSASGALRIKVKI